MLDEILRFIDTHIAPSFQWVLLGGPRGRVNEPDPEHEIRYRQIRNSRVAANDLDVHLPHHVPTQIARIGSSQVLEEVNPNSPAESTFEEERTESPQPYETDSSALPAQRLKPSSDQSEFRIRDALSVSASAKAQWQSKDTDRVTSSLDEHQQMLNKSREEQRRRWEEAQPIAEMLLELAREDDEEIIHLEERLARGAGPADFTEREWARVFLRHFLKKSGTKEAEYHAHTMAYTMNEKRRKRDREMAFRSKIEEWLWGCEECNVVVSLEQ